MTALTSLGEQEATAQSLLATQHDDHQLSRRSSEVEYEIAEQLIQHSQQRRDCNGANAISSDKDRRPSLDLIAAVTALDGQQGVSGHNYPPIHEARGKPPHDRPQESQYSPTNVPPAMGQICR